MHKINYYIMSCILYYSNHCQHSQKLLKELSQSTIKDEIHFISIDNRETATDGQTIINLEKNQKVILPTSVTRVPALLLINKNYEVLFGDDIHRHLQPKQQQITQVATQSQGEPMAFTLGGGSVVSDNYSFLDMTSDDLSAKGGGGTRQMHSYASLDFNDKIQTPEDNYDPNKVNDGDLERLQRERDSDIKMPAIRPT